MAKKNNKLRKIILKCDLSPGDVLMLAATVRDIKRAHSNFLIDVRTSVPSVWENNPHLTALDEDDSDVEVIDTEYPLIHSSNTRPYHFIHGYPMFLEEKLGVKIPVTEFKGDIHLTDVEKSWMSQIQEYGVFQDFWIVFSGGKYDYTAKWWNPLEMQKVISHFKNKILFVQAGESDHHHPKLKGVLNLIGKTDTRQLIRLVYHSVGVLSPVTFGMHLAAAVETARHRPINRAAVVISGGREPVNWEAYPHHRFLAVNGSLDCCDNGGCWKSRTFRLEDGDEKDESLCVYPEEINYDIKVPPKNKKQKLQIPKCMNMIKAKDVIQAIEWYYENTRLNYDGGWEKAKEAVAKHEKEPKKPSDRVEEFGKVEPEIVTKTKTKKKKTPRFPKSMPKTLDF